MENLYHDTSGLIHLITAALAVLSGTAVILMQKGSRRHKQIGYVYVISMTIMLLTSFMIYRLFDGFGIFHFFSIVSTLTLLGGMVPALLRKPSNWLPLHFSFMYWSVFGLYAAFVAEIFTRVPGMQFYNMLGVAIFLVMGAGYFFWYKNKKKWSAQMAT